MINPTTRDTCINCGQPHNPKDPYDIVCQNCIDAYPGGKVGVEEMVTEFEQLKDMFK